MVDRDDRVDADWQPFLPIRMRVTLFLAGLASLAYLCRNCVSVMSTPISEDLNLSEKQIGLILGPAFFWSYALGQIPMGRLGERLGARISLPCMVCVWSLATAAFGVIHWFPLLFLVWCLMGLAQAGAIPVSMNTISVWNPKSERAFASGIFVAAMYSGAALAAGATGALIAFIPWQLLLAIFGAPGFVWAVLFIWWFRNRPEDHPSVSRTELEVIRESVITEAPAALDSDKASLQTPWLQLLTSRAMWLICGQQFCRAAGLIFFASWFPKYLKESHQITVEKSALLAVLPHLATMAAGLIGGRLADLVFRRTGKLSWSRKGVAVISLTLSTALLIAAYFVSDVTMAVAVFSMGVFCATLAGPCAYAITIDMGGKHITSVFATMNMMGNFGAGLFPVIVPLMRDWIKARPTVLESLGNDSWNAVLILVALLHLVAALCWTQLRITGTVFDRAAPMDPPSS